MVRLMHLDQVLFPVEERPGDTDERAEDVWPILCGNKLKVQLGTSQKARPSPRYGVGFRHALFAAQVLRTSSRRPRDTCSALAICFCCVLTAHGTEPESRSWDINGTERHAIVHAPTKEDPAGSPLLLVFHGISGTARCNHSPTRGTSTNTGPKRLSYTCRGCPYQPEKIQTANVPAGRVSPAACAIATLNSSMPSSPISKRITISIENEYTPWAFLAAAAFTFLLWSQRPGTFAAFAPCAAPLPKKLKLRIPRPVFIVAGKADKFATIQGEEATIERLRQLNGASADGKQIDEGVTYYSSTKDAPVATLIHAGAHRLPKQAPKLNVDFFRVHPQKR